MENETTVKVIKCGKCNRFFGWTKADPNCPFCKVAHGEIEGRAADEVEGKPKVRKLPVKSKKESFKIWDAE